MKILWKSIVVECIRLPSDFWYIRPLTFQVVECIKSGRMYQISVRLLIHSTTDVASRQTSDTFDHWRSKWSNVSDLMKINENLWQSMKIIRNLMKIVWTSMKGHENQWKSDENPMKILWKVVYQTFVRLLLHSTTEVLSGRMYQILWKSQKIREHQTK